MNIRISFLAQILSLLFVGYVFGEIHIDNEIPVFEPIIVTADDDASLFIWDYDELELNVAELDKGKTLHIWAKPNLPKERYRLQLAAITIDFDAKTINYKKYIKYFTVVGEVPPIPPVPPVPPIPPIPPVPPVPPPPTPTDFESKVREALKKVDTNALSAKSIIATNYKNIADEAFASPAVYDPATMLNEVKSRNLSTVDIHNMRRWSRFWPELTRAFIELNLDKGDLKGHIDAFYDVHSALTNNSGSNIGMISLTKRSEKNKRSISVEYMRGKK